MWSLPSLPASSDVTIFPLWTSAMLVSFWSQGITLYLKIDTLYMWQSLWLSLPTTNDHVPLPSSPLHTHTHTHTDTHTHTPPFYSCLILPPPSLGFPDGSASKESTCNVGGTDSFPGAERSPGEGHGNPLQYSRPENSMIRGAWQESMGLQIVGYNWAHGTYTPLQEHQNRVVAKAFRSNPVSSPRIFHRCYHPINFLHVQLCMAWVIPSHPSH